MELSPKLYNWLVRPGWFSQLFINDVIKNEFDFNCKTVLDFGCGTGTSSSMFEPGSYYGVDCDLRRILYAQYQNPGYNFSVLRGHTMPVYENSFDYILVIAVLHHIPKHELPLYLKDFKRVLKPQGTILVIEPYLSEGCYFSNLFMKFVDRGKYIEGEEEYLELFRNCNYKVEVHKRYKQLCFYNKLFFSATPAK